MKEILISAPVRNRAWILPEYLERIENIKYGKQFISVYFLLNDSTDESGHILNEWKEKNKHLYKSIEIQEMNFGNPRDWGEDRSLPCKNPRQKYTYNTLAKLRTKILEHARYLNVDYILSIDTDVLVNPDILWNLLREKRNIIASLIVNGITKDEEIKAYNFLPLDRETPRTLLPKKVFKVAVTGACYLISKKVFMNEEIDYVGLSGTAEDKTFCKKAIAQGFDCFVLKDLQEHILSKQRYLQGQLQIQVKKKISQEKK